MKVTSALFLTTAILAGSAFAKRHRHSSSSTDSSSTDSSSTDSSSSSSSGSSSTSSSDSSSSSGSSSDSSSSSRNSTPEDYGINGCENADAFTLLHKGFRHYDFVVKQNSRSAFLATKAEIKSNSDVVKSIKDNKKKQTLVLNYGKVEFAALEKIKRSRKIKKAVKAIVKKFKKDTGMKLNYVMLPVGAKEKYVDAFTKNGVTVISKARKVASASDIDASSFNGIVVVETKTMKKSDLEKLKKAMKKSSVAAIPLRECVPTGSSAQRNVESETETETDAEVVQKSAAMKANDAESESEAEVTDNNTAATPANPQTEQKKVTAADSSAASVVVSSVLAIAAIAAVSAFLL